MRKRDAIWLIIPGAVLVPAAVFMPACRETYLAATCVNCTLTGTNKKPNFWP
jgi:hypothetical protein